MEIRKGHPVQWISTQWSTEMSGPPFGAVRRLVAAFLPAPNLKAPLGKTLRSQGRAKYPTPDLAHSSAQIIRAAMSIRGQPVRLTGGGAERVSCI
jgi:hypothetical protein